MKVLLAIPHFFRADRSVAHGSTRLDPGLRGGLVRGVLQAWRGHFGPTSVLSVANGRFEPAPAKIEQLDIVALTHGSDHLLDPATCRRFGVQLQPCTLSDPRLLGFAAPQLFAARRDAYDLFVYSEDDLRPWDAALLDKAAGFAETFGQQRVLAPNRFEWNAGGPSQKTYIDGDLPAAQLARWTDKLPDEPHLTATSLGREVVFRRAGNPHAGFYALTRAQLDHWMAQPHFGELDFRFVGPLESAATLGMLKTFAVYKPAGRDMSFLEIEHLDTRYSGVPVIRVPADDITQA